MIFARSFLGAVRATITPGKAAALVARTAIRLLLAAANAEPRRPRPEVVVPELTLPNI